MTTQKQLRSVESVADALRAQAYIADHSLATAIFLALRLKRPLFLEGEAGVGKTEVAKTLAQMLDAKLIRLQCYEGLDVSSAVYEWNYARQMLQIRLMKQQDGVGIPPRMRPPTGTCGRRPSKICSAIRFCCAGRFSRR